MGISQNHDEIGGVVWKTRKLSKKHRAKKGVWVGMRRFYGDFVRMYRMVMLTYTHAMHILDLMMGFPNSQANGNHQPGMIVLTPMSPCPFYFIVRFTSEACLMSAIHIICIYIYIHQYQLYHVLGIYFTVFSACLSKIHLLHLHTPSCPISFRYVLFILGVMHTYPTAQQG